MPRAEYAPTPPTRKNFEARKMQPAQKQTPSYIRAALSKHRIPASLSELGRRRYSPNAIDTVVDEIVGPLPREADFGNDYLAYHCASEAYHEDRRITGRQVEALVKTDGE